MPNTLEVLNKINDELKTFAKEVSIDMLGAIKQTDAIYLAGSLDAIGCMQEYVDYLIRKEREKI